MTLTLQRLEDIAQRLTVEQYGRLLAFADALAWEASQTPPEAAAADLRRRWERNFPALLRRRLRELTRKLEAETITDAERAECAALAEQSARATTARLAAVAQLMKQHGLTREQAVAVLGLGGHRRG